MRKVIWWSCQIRSKRMIDIWGEWVCEVWSQFIRCIVEGKGLEAGGPSRSPGKLMEVGTRVVEYEWSQRGKLRFLRKMPLTFFLFRFNFLFWNNFKLTKKLQKHYEGLLCTCHPDSLIVNMLLHLLYYSFFVCRVCILLCYFFMNPLQVSYQLHASSSLNTSVCIS